MPLPAHKIIPEALKQRKTLPS